MAESRDLDLIESDDLSDDLRERLGIGPGEWLRPVESSPRTLVIERMRDPATIPCMGPSALRADVSILPLSDVLQALHAAGRSGFVYFTYRDHAKSVYMHRGEVVFASSNQRVDRLGECLLRAGVISLDQLREAERCFSPPERFGKVLVERGFLTPRELWNGVKYQVEEIVRSLFAYPTGSVFFWEGEVQPDNVVRLSLETRRLVAEGIQRRDELMKFLTVLEDPRVRLASVEGFESQLAGSERALADAIGEQRSFKQVCEALDQDRESAARSIQLLRLVGAVKLIRSAEGEPGFLDESDLRVADDESLRERVAALTKLTSELAGAISRVEGTPEIVERLERVLDDATGRFPALLTGVSLGAGASLDPEVLVSRALKLPGDREQQLISALGELVTYLEFEVKNHPGIDDPQDILDSVGELRSSAWTIRARPEGSGPLVAHAV